MTKLSGLWVTEYDNHGNGSFSEWFTISKPDGPCLKLPFDDMSYGEAESLAVSIITALSAHDQLLAALDDLLVTIDEDFDSPCTPGLDGILCDHSTCHAFGCMHDKGERARHALAAAGETKDGAWDDADREDGLDILAEQEPDK